MKKLIAILFLLLLAQPTFALLSPLNQSIEEIHTLIVSKELQNYLPQSEGLQEVLRIDNGYLLKTATLQMVVEIIYLPMQRPGAQAYKFVFHEPTKVEDEDLSS